MSFIFKTWIFLTKFFIKTVFFIPRRVASFRYDLMQFIGKRLPTGNHLTCWANQEMTRY